MQASVPHAGEGRNNPWLDLVRGLAIVLVLLRHGERALQASGGEPLGFLQTLFVNGWVGVDLFFVLSGYLIARHLFYANTARTFAFSRYIAMRALRIVPAYLAVLALVVAGAFPFYVVAPEGLPIRVAYHLLFLQDYLPSNINVVYWSLGVEEKFYLLAPLLVLLLLRARTAFHKLGLLLVLFSLPVVFRTAMFLRLSEAVDYQQFFVLFRSPFHMTLEGLVVGVAIATAQHSGMIRASRDVGLLVLLGSAAALFAWLASHDFMARIGAFDAIAQPAIMAVLAGSLTLGAVQLAKTAMPFERPVNLLARLSYSLYLVHFPLIPLSAAMAADRGALVFWGCYLSLSFGSASLLYHLVERPFLRWKDRLGSRASTRATAASEPVAPLVISRP
jgi:peptidoglycan/LPS O-acetylase OafA/YrhL